MLTKINGQRALDMFYIFGEGMMITNSPDLKKFEKRMGVDARDFLKNIINGIAIDGVKPQHLEDFSRHIMFMRDACNYILMKTDEIPAISAVKTKDGIAYKI